MDKHFILMLIAIIAIVAICIALTAHHILAGFVASLVGMTWICVLVAIYFAMKK